MAYEFRRMRIYHPLLLGAHKEFDKLRQLRRKMIETGIDVEANCFGLFGESQAGKSVTVASYLENQVVDYCYDTGLFDRSVPRIEVMEAQRVVVYISLTGSTLKSFYGDILRAYGDPRPERGNIGDLAYRVYNYIRRFKTELLIFDETQHLRIGAPVSFARLEAGRVHNSLKDFLLSGFPVVFVGTDEAEKRLMNEHQIGFRGCRKIPYRKLDFKLAEDRKIFEDYCGLIGVKLAEHGLFQKRSNFLAGDIVPCLFEATGGYLGRVSRLIEAAAGYALDEGATIVERRHLVLGCDEFSIGNGLITRNPFLDEELQNAA
ncbi:ATP-binding protein [Rhizobium sp. Root1220]|uniref:ATP-binding protein n=1 Tax=Rhizobium sp. Root1220 TaxID=1736432 RepID=UPI00138F3F50|nr:ATP-binding protein [Rhizobium sp. Root1220]